MKKLIVCPECKYIEEIPTTEWRNVYREIVEYEFVYKDVEERISSEVEEHLYCYHSCGFETKNWTVEDFIVEIEKGKIVSTGNYWNYEMDKLHEILDKNLII